MIINSALIWNTKSNITKMHGQQHLKEKMSLLAENFVVWAVITEGKMCTKNSTGNYRTDITSPPAVRFL